MYPPTVRSRDDLWPFFFLVYLSVTTLCLPRLPNTQFHPRLLRIVPRLPHLNVAFQLVHRNWVTTVCSALTLCFADPGRTKAPTRPVDFDYAYHTCSSLRLATMVLDPHGVIVLASSAAFVLANENTYPRSSTEKCALVCTYAARRQRSEPFAPWQPLDRALPATQARPAGASSVEPGISPSRTKSSHCFKVFARTSHVSAFADSKLRFFFDHIGQTRTPFHMHAA
ncbi:hypothetical protein PLICRDRAFT_646644 [Plicaturopsis crispa FD-325 SS-3]|nr:hypothetical protein PLICRDRAFT_646644 [Plicaturopsis crispa FD-325 SS-3]